MALTATQKITLNKLLSQFPSTSTRSTLLADMWEALTGAAADAIKAQWKSETAAKIAAAKAGVDSTFDDGTGTINSA
jgi:hypothetical protein